MGKHENKKSVYVGCQPGEAVWYGWQVLGIYNVGVKLLNSIRRKYVNSLACVRVKGGEWVLELIIVSERVCHFSLAFQRVHGCGNERGENGGMKNENKIFRGKRMKTTWSLVCRWACFVQWNGTRSESDGRAFWWGMQDKGSEKH